MNAFLRPLITSVNQLYHEGIHITGTRSNVCGNDGICLYSSGIQISTPAGKRVAKAALIICSCDLPARAIVLNTNQFNWGYACHMCEDPGVTEAGKPLHRFWPYNPRSIPRTHMSLLTCAKRAMALKAIVND